MTDREPYTFGDPIVTGVHERDQIVILIDFTTADEIPRQQTLIMKRSEYQALRRHVETELMAGARELVASWHPTLTDDRQALGDLLGLLGLSDVEYKEPYRPERDPDLVWVCAACKRAITQADSYVVIGSEGSRAVVYHKECEL